MRLSNSHCSTTSQWQPVFAGVTAAAMEKRRRISCSPNVMVFVHSLAMSHHSVQAISHISSLDSLVVTGATVEDDWLTLARLLPVSVKNGFDPSKSFIQSVENGRLLDEVCFFSLSTSSSGNFSIWRRCCHLSSAVNNKRWCQRWFKVGNTSADIRQWLLFIECYRNGAVFVLDIIFVTVWGEAHPPGAGWQKANFRLGDESFRLWAHLSVALLSVMNPSDLLLVKLQAWTTSWARGSSSLESRNVFISLVSLLGACVFETLCYILCEAGAALWPVLMLTPHINSLKAQFNILGNTLIS